MKISKSEEILFDRPKPRIYTEVELKHFHELIQKYYEEYTLETGKDKGKKIRWLNYQKLSIAFGAVDKRGGVIVKNYSEESDGRGGTKYSYDMPTRQQQFENLMDQYYLWKGKKEWVEQKKLEGLQEVAETMSIKIDPAEEEFNKW
jgi:hypothetical protein